jgi:predicted transcriptional regulator
MLTLGTVAQRESKAAVRQLLDEVPDGCTPEEILYKLDFLDLVQRSLAEADAGKLAPHGEVMAELRRKRSRPAAW